MLILYNPEMPSLEVEHLQFCIKFVNKMKRFDMWISLHFVLFKKFRWVILMSALIVNVNLF